MALPSSGQISLSSIRTELLNTGTNNFSLKNAGGYTGRDTPYVPVNQSSFGKPNTTSPYQASEWYDYDHSASTLCSQVVVSSQTFISNRIYYKITITGCTGQSTNIFVRLQDEPNNSYNHTVNVYDFYPFNNIGGLSLTTPLFNATLKSIDQPEVSFPYILTSSSDILYLVAWNSSIL
jgi:hypothetical protein